MIWILDIPGAGLSAAGLACAVSGLAAGEGLQPAAVAMILTGGAIRAGAAFAVHATAIRTAQRAVAAWRARLYPRLLAGRLTRPLLAGESAALAIDHMGTIEAYQARFRPVRAASAVAPLLVAAMVALASWVSAAILMVTLLPFALGMILAGTAARHASERQLAALTQLSGLFVDRIRALPIIHHFGAEDRITRQVGITTREVADRTLAVLRVAFLSGAVLEFFAALSVALVAVYCGFSLLGLLPFPAPETLSLGQAFFALAMAPEFYLPMRRLAAAYHDKQLGEAAGAALAVVDAETPALTARARFEGLHVSDLAIQWPDLHIGPVTFDLAQGDLLALTGPTGSGKSSLLAAIAGQIVPAAGTITTARGGAIEPSDIAWAAQTPLLLPGTLAENIALGRPDATIHEIAEVASQVGLSTLLSARGGLALPLDHRGSGLSGGERRRIGLARAILSGRPLLLCDEPTADLDAQSSTEIINLLKALARDRAVLVVTHDPALASAARIAVAL